MQTALLSTTYFGPVQWYQKLHRHDRVLIEQHEAFQKQTYRNRCLIATAQGVQALTVPVVHEPLATREGEHTDGADIRSVRISDHGNWRHQHWQALASAYGDSPFFEYYEDDIRPFFAERNWELLLDFNDDICQTICRLADIHPHMGRTHAYAGPQPQEAGHPRQRPHGAGGDDGLPVVRDYREAIRPKHPAVDPEFTPREYYQVFAQKNGFLPNMSILDLLFNMGPESIFYL